MIPDCVLLHGWTSDITGSQCQQALQVHWRQKSAAIKCCTQSGIINVRNIGFLQMACLCMQVRIWSVERSQEQILDNMRIRDGIADQSGLVAYWTFDDPNM